MAIKKWQELNHEKMSGDDICGTTLAVAVGPDEGWKDNILRVVTIEPGGHSPHHQHDYEHVNYVIKGNGTLTIGEDTREFNTGDFAVVPPNVIHQYRNPTDEEFVFICIIPNIHR